MIYKHKDITTNINSNINLGNIGSNFYTEDRNSAIIRIFIKYNNSGVNLEKDNLTPYINIFAEDDSIFTDEKVDIVQPSIGLIQYRIPERVIKHKGRMDCKLFLRNETQSIHIANFYFYIVDSGIEEAIAKEIDVNLIQDTVTNVVKNNLDNLLTDDFKVEITNTLKDYVDENSERFVGPQGEQGIQGIQGERGSIGPQGEQGPPGPKGDKGDKGEPFKYENFTQEQLEQLRPTLPNFSNWQKFKLTNDDGSVITDFNLNIDFNDIEQLKALPNGFRYVTKTSNLPNNISSGFGWVLKLSRPDIQMFSIYFQPYNSNQIVQKTFYNTLSDWRYISGNQTDTGWLPLPLINGASQAGTANLPKYRLVSINDTNMLFFQGAVKGISSSTMAFSRLPTNISQKINSYAEYSKVKINPYTNTSAIYNITMTTSGELKITFEPNSTAETSSPYYIEGIISL